MSGRPPIPLESLKPEGDAGPSGAAGGGGGAGDANANALENAIQVRISGSLHVGCILSAKCKMPKGSRKARFKWQRLGRLGPRSKENLPDGKTAMYQIKPEDAGCWLRVACAPLLSDGSVGPISSAISRKRISGTPILNADTLRFLESQPVAMPAEELPANAWDGPSAKQLKWMNLMDQTGASMADVDLSSDDQAREARQSQSSNNAGQQRAHGLRRNGSGSSTRSDTNGLASPPAQQGTAGASPLPPGTRDSFRDAEFFSPPVFIPKIPPMDIPFTPQTAHDGGAAAAAAGAGAGRQHMSPAPPFPSLAPAGAEEVTPVPKSAAWNRGASTVGDSMTLVPERIPGTPIWASLSARELDRLFSDFTFAQRDTRRSPLDPNGPTRAEDILRFAEETSKPGQTRAEALMSIATSVAKDAPPSVKRSDLLMELAETIPPSPNRAQLLMQLFMAAEEAPTPYH